MCCTVLVDGLSVDDIQRIAGLSAPPRLSEDDEDEDADEEEDDKAYTPLRKKAVVVDSAALIAVKEQRLNLFYYAFTFGPKAAVKYLSPYSLAPAIGLDITITNFDPRPRQDEYPVPYFLFGTLCDSLKLHALLALNKKLTLVTAVLQKARLTRWGQYYALDDRTEEVWGAMYLVQRSTRIGLESTRRSCMRW